MPQNPKQLPETKSHTHCHHFYNGECRLSDAMCVCRKVENLTGKEKAKIHVPKNADLQTRTNAQKLKELFEADGTECEIITH